MILGLTGWRTEGQLPSIPKFVLVGAPHTSNWDLPFTLFIAFAFRAPIHWMGKEAIFRRPFNGLFKWLGGIPIRRSESHNQVEQSIQQFNRNDQLILTIAPAGTRKRVIRWKTGFYHIARKANIPIYPVAFDFGTKVVIIKEPLIPTEDIENDFRQLIGFYAGTKGKYPELGIDMSILEKTISGQK